MALLNLNLEPNLLKQLIQVLSRIADGIDRAYPPLPSAEARKTLKPHGPEDLIEFNPEEEWLREEQEDQKQR